MSLRNITPTETKLMYAASLFKLGTMSIALV